MAVMLYWKLEMKKNTNRIITVGFIKKSEKGTKHQSNVVYDTGGGMPLPNWKYESLHVYTGEEMNDEIQPKLVGGVGVKDSNSGTQYKQQNRIYDSNEVAISVTTGFLPWYLVYE